MLICIPDVLSKWQVTQMRRTLDEANWIDGKATAGSVSGLVKQNSQLPEGSPLAVALGGIILDALGAHPLFVSAALPLRTFPPLFNRYGQGDRFGLHVDNAIRPIKGTAVKLRTDLSATLFLCEPDEYDGGELVIETAFGGQEIKLEAGSLVLYPSTSLHRVLPITRGTRTCSFFWIQSMVRDEAQRTTLFDLDQSIQALTTQFSAQHQQVIQLSAVYHNLIRMWADS